MSYIHCQISLRRARLEAVCAALSRLNLPDISLRHTDPSSLTDDPQPDAMVMIGCEYPSHHEKQVIATLIASGRTHQPGDLHIRFADPCTAPGTAAKVVKGAVTLTA